MAEENGEIVENISGAQSFEASVPAPDPMRAAVELKPAPSGIPEKFWDGEKGEVRIADLVKSYGELETKLSAPKDPDPDPATDPDPNADPTPDPNPAADPDPNKDPDPKPAEEDPEGGDPAQVDLADAMTAAQATYAEKGELPAEAREPFLKAGISNEQIDLYLSGVKAHEEGLKVAAMKAAGVEDYSEVQKAVEWAAKNWSEKKILAFNAQTGDVETVGLAVGALFKEYVAAEPGEGRLTNINGGTNRGDVYGERAEFDRDLKAADDARDPLARKAAVAKMDRSLKAKSLKK